MAVESRAAGGSLCAIVTQVWDLYDYVVGGTQNIEPFCSLVPHLVKQLLRVSDELS